MLLSLIHISAGGYTVREITDCHTYDEYQELAESRICLSYNPAAVLAGQTLEERLSQKHLHLPLSYEPEEIRENLQRLAAELSLPLPDFAALEREAEAALARAREAAGDMPDVYKRQSRRCSALPSCPWIPRSMRKCWVNALRNTTPRYIW